MRKIVALTLMSIDGAVDDPSLYFQPSDRPDEPFVFDDESDAFAQATTSSQDAVLLGRNMWDQWRTFWPEVSSPFADFINGVQKYVVTHARWTGSGRDRSPYTGPLERVVADLKADPGGDVGVHGSIQLVQSLLDADLLDELRIIAGPEAGAPGRRLFENLSAPKRYRLVSAASTPSALGIRPDPNSQPARVPAQVGDLADAVQFVAFIRTARIHRRQVVNLHPCRAAGLDR